jgi:hypothetical protein
MESSLHSGSLALAVLVAAVGAFMLIRADNRNTRVLILWGSVGLLIFATDRLLIVTNVERIHYPQYAILSILLLMSFGHEFFVVFLATFAGMIDEFTQFVWHPQHTKYLDFNDFVLNALGALLGVTLFLTLSSRARLATRKLRRIRIVTYVVAGSILGLAGVGALMGRIIPYMGEGHNFQVLTRIDGKLAFVLSFIDNPDFWTVSEYGRRYHILSPLEGMIVLGLLLALYRYLLRNPSINQ